MATGTTNHDEIRSWAEAKGGKPAAVDRTHQGGDVGIIRIMFPDNPQSEHHSLVEISWDEFFEQFEDSGLALLYEEDSLFSKIVGRDTLERREHGEHASRHHGSGKSDAQESAGQHSPSRQQEGSKHSAPKADSEQAAAPRAEPAKGAKTESRTESASDDLEAREYKDERGNIHHHTTKYAEQHPGRK